jgi:hypothetical protein
MRSDFIINRKSCKLLLFIFFLLIINHNSYAQESNYSAGLNTGIASFESLSAPVTGLQFNAFFEFPAWFTKAFNFQASIFYLRKTEFFLPEQSAGSYYPYFYGASLSGVMRQQIKETFFVEEQAGLLILKNKFFSAIEATNYGVCFGVFGGVNLKGNSGHGFLLSIGYKGTLTFNGDTPTINSFLIQAQYFF